MNIPRILAMTMLMLSSAVALAQGPQGGPGPGGMQAGGAQGGAHRGPPQEALDACKGKKDGDSAQMRTPRGDSVSGVCRLVMVPGDAKNAAPQRKDAPAQR